MCAAQQTHVIDDASPLIVYRAPSLDRNLTGFEPDKLKDGTVTFIAATQNDSPTISMNFTGAFKLETGMTSADVG
jgi:hypothetical protein